MSQEEPEFKIKGAASLKGSPPASISSNSEKEDQPTNMAKAEIDSTANMGKPEDADLTQEQLEAKYRWFKCVLPATQPGEADKVYYLHYDTQESKWEQPDEPYWVWDAYNQAIDRVAGLQQPEPPRRPSIPEGWQGYIPAIHGDYDPNAPYAKFHEALRAQEAAQASQNQQAPGVANYGSSMAFNRFTGNAQQAGLNPERYSDSAKASRQQNAYFDADAAANSHDGKSLKAERREQKVSKKQLQEFRKRNKEKKEQKKRAFYMS